MRFSSHKLIPISLFLFLAILPLTWFREPGAFLYIHDQDLPLSIYEIVQKSFVWSERWLGSDNSYIIFRLFPEGFLYMVLYRLGFSLKISEMIIFCVLFLLPALFMYLLLKEILSYGKSSSNDLKIESASTIGALLYSFNLYLVIIWHSGIFINVVFAYAFLPLFIKILWQLGFKKCKRYLHMGIILGLLASLVGPTSVPILMASVIMGSGLFVLFYILITDRNYIKQLIVGTAFAVLIALTVNLWWFIPHFYSTITTSSLFQSSSDYSLNYVGLSGQRGGLLTQFQLHNSWTWGTTWAGRLFQSFSSTYKNRSLVILWFSIMALSLTILLKKRNHFMVIYSAIFLLLSLFLAKGLQSPLGKIFKYLYIHVPYFCMFRTPDTKFGIGIVFSLSVLLSFSLHAIFQNFKMQRFQALFSLLLSIGIIAYSWPFLTGVAVVEKNQGLMFDRLVKIPAFYSQLAENINKDRGQFRVAMIPGFVFASFKWGNANGITGPDLLAKLIKKPVIHRSEHTTAFQYSGFIGDAILKKHDFGLLPLLNIKYIILRNDTLWQHYKEIPSSILKKGNIPFVESQSSFGHLDLYKISDEYFLPHIYACP